MNTKQVEQSCIKVEFVQKKLRQANFTESQVKALITIFAVLDII